MKFKKFKNKSSIDLTLFIGIDNGVTGTIGIIGIEDCKDAENGIFYIDFFKTPIKKTEAYQKYKSKQGKTEVRFDSIKFVKKVITPVFLYLDHYIDFIRNKKINLNFYFTIERPMINPKRFVSSISAARSLEATLSGIDWMEYIFKERKELKNEIINELDITDFCINTNYKFIDSKNWQKGMLVRYDLERNENLNKKEKEKELKELSKKAGKLQLNSIYAIDKFDVNHNLLDSIKIKELNELIDKHGDADGLLIAFDELYNYIEEVE